MPRDSSSDAELIRRVADGDRAAFREVFEAFKEPVFRFLVKMVGDREMAHDLASEVMIAVWRSAGRFAGRSTVSSWIFGIARNKALSELRRRRPEPLQDETSARLEDPGPTPERAAQHTDLSRRLAAAVDQLAPDYREVVHLAHYQELSVREIADVLDCPEATVKTRMFRARRQLHQALSEAGIRGISG